MMRVLLLPRLNALGVTTVLDGSASSAPTPNGNFDVLEEHSAYLSFAASGGSRAEKLAGEITVALREIAGRVGFPADVGQKERAKFDQEAAIYFGELSALQTGEALRNDVWAFLTTIMAPDIVAWRYPDKASHRFEGGVRNTFQRLWMRGAALDRGEDHEDRWLLVRSLSEDAMVQIFERPSIGGNRPLAIAIAESWLRTSEIIGRGAMEAVMRRATKILRLRNEILDLALLTKAELESTTFEALTLARTVD